MLFFLFFVGCLASLSLADKMPLPWSRQLELEDPPMNGNDVVIAQNLLNRAATANGGDAIVVDGIFGETTVKSVKQFQVTTFGGSNKEYAAGSLDEVTAQELLDHYSSDNVKDDGTSASDMGAQVQVLNPVSSNRSVEPKELCSMRTIGFFTNAVRAHGKRDDNGAYAWLTLAPSLGMMASTNFCSRNTPPGW